ncbi:DUF1134 domain-containing protein [Erythrobacter sp. YT30]|uniref:DUF1134 domain-containing protein n=1 Tax=Erythrobacter sp. YT30 TaxID=1735012 RepID=UPI00076D1C99|nr:DUF1134 domain-containing protein [Erythrobacter sp. YT30]KWV92238.1 hypothetical protein AUC45_06890 [Erythrobacter sp. YT30]
MVSRFIKARSTLSNIGLHLLAALALVSTGTVASAQGVETFDPDEIFEVAEPSPDNPEVSAAPGSGGAIDADLADPNAPQPVYTVPQPVPEGTNGPAQVETNTPSGFDQEFDAYSAYGSADPAANQPAPGEPIDITPAAVNDNSTYGEDDLIGAAEGVFGKGAEGLAKMIQDLLKDQGQPNGYIVGREAGGAFVFGARYGSGTLHHKIEGQRKVYWTGPSVGFDAGANAANTFILVYNLYDTQELFKRYAAGEGQAYLVGGLHASYVRRGDKVLIPIRMGVGARLGINAGYLKFSEKQRWLPF